MQVLLARSAQVSTGSTPTDRWLTVGLEHPQILVQGQGPEAHPPCKLKDNCNVITDLKILSFFNNKCQHGAVSAHQIFYIVELYISENASPNSINVWICLCCLWRNIKNLVFVCLFCFIEVELIYNVVVMSAVQQSDSIIHIYLCILFYILFH